VPQFTPEEFNAYYQKFLHPLHVLVQVANVSVNSKISVTINVKGIFISGYLVALKDFHNYISDTMIGSMEDAPNEDDVIRDMRNVVKSMEVLYNDPNFKDLVSSYICIKDPQFVLGGGGSLAVPGQFWVGRLESVDGFMLGIVDQIGPQQETPGTE
jgi:hypothetical protein